MPPPDLLLAFIGASALLIAMPGPNAALIVARTLSHGRRAGLATLCGTWSGAAIQLGIVAAGLAALAAAMSDIMQWVRWIGAAYLVVQGARLFFARSSAAQDDVPAPPRNGSLVLEGLLTGLANPKSLVFYGAFLPHFVAPDRPAGPQLVVLALVFLLMAFPGDSLWIFGAGYLRGLARGSRFTDRIAGGILVGAGAGLALVRRG